MKKYWHELPQQEIEEMIKFKKTVRYILDNYHQPTWCSYPDAIELSMGCWSLTDNREGGLRTKISPEYCAQCECNIKQTEP